MAIIIKLQDIIQERKGTIFDKFEHYWIILEYFELYKTTRLQSKVLSLERLQIWVKVRAGNFPSHERKGGS